jgi:hypothetical protein
MLPRPNNEAPVFVHHRLLDLGMGAASGLASTGQRKF